MDSYYETFLMSSKRFQFQLASTLVIWWNTCLNEFPTVFYVQLIGSSPSELEWLWSELPTRMKIIVSCANGSPVFQSLSTNIKSQAAFINVSTSHSEKNSRNKTIAVPKVHLAYLQCDQSSKVMHVCMLQLTYLLFRMHGSNRIIYSLRARYVRQVAGYS